LEGVPHDEMILFTTKRKLIFAVRKQLQSTKSLKYESMGVIKRQGIKQSMVTYVGVAIGFVNVLFIYPAFLQEDQIGIISYVRETAAMMSLFVFLGSTEVITRFFPLFKDEKNSNNGFLTLLLAIVTAGCFLLTLASLFFREQIFVFFGKKEEPMLYLQFAHLILPITILIAYGNLFFLYAANFKRIVVPTLINELLPKLVVPALVIAFYYDKIPFGAIMYGSLVVYAAMLIAQAWYIHHLRQFHFRPKFRFLTKKLAKEMANFSLYGFVGSLGSRFSSEFLNFFMLGTISTLTNTGIYNIAYSISNVVDVPRKAISRIASPLLAEKFNEGKLADVEDIYHKSSINQLIVALWVFLSVWVCIDQIFEIMPNGERYVGGKYVVLLLGIARIVDMATGVNSEIISFSKYYRYNFYLILLMAVVHISSSFYFIKSQGLVGVAIATLITMTVYNIAKFAVLWWKLKMQPFSGKTPLVLLFAALAFLPVNFLPSTGHAILDLGARCLCFSLAFGSFVVWAKASPDINHLVTNGVGLARKWLGLR
jgi:O-antigen/teichoic acid export membrane protein